LKTLEQSFTPRQYMVTPDFEFFHYIDESVLNVEYHNHEFYEVYLFISGKVTYVIEGKSYILRPGDIVLINNSELHKPIIETGELYERIVIWLDPNYIKEQSTDGTNLFMCFESSSKNRYNLIRPKAEIAEHIRDIANKIGHECSFISYGSNILKKVYLTELIIYLNKAYLDTNDEEIETDIKYNHQLNMILKYINENLGEDLSLETLSSRFFISKYYLLREFTKQTGYTIHKYIQKKRLIMAKKLLREFTPVTEVCMRCGFGDYSNFIRAFKKEFGTSPRKFSIQSKSDINIFGH